MRTEIYPRKRDTLPVEFFAHLLGQTVKVFFRVITPTNARLICHNNQRITGITERPHRIDHAWQKGKLFPISNVARINVDNAVPIQKYSGACHQLAGV